MNDRSNRRGSDGAGRLRLASIAIALAVLVLSGAAAEGVTLDFFNISNNAPAGVDVAGQFSAEVTDSGGDVLFTFFNDDGPGSVPAFITEIYVDDDSGGLFAGASILGGPFTSPGVNYVSGANPFNLPGGNGITPKFGNLNPGVPPIFLPAWAFEPVTPGTNNDGVDPGESLGLLFDGDYAATLSALETGVLRIGLRGQGIGQSGKSDSFLSLPPEGQIGQPPPVIPEPITVAALAMGVGGLGGYLRRRR